MIYSKPQEITRARARAGLSMRELSRKADLNIATISKIESRRDSVLPSTARRIADTLGKDMEELFTVECKEVEA